MASSKEYVNDITEQCKGLSARAMMGDYVLYCGGKVIGGIYDNRLLVKPTPSAVAMLPDAKKELPYEGAKEMLFVEETDDGDLLSRLFEAISRELPEPRKRK
ncbi:MAG: TfoX/Sxy family protein [Clostridia bacterium]|nr:TfoX/Sxy family protein [Clostridia bacterium]